jgi:hypothetical protein
MNRIVKIFLPFLLLFFGRRFFAGSGQSTGSSSDQSASHPQQASWITQKFAGLIHNVTGTELSQQDMRWLSILVFAYSFVLGFVVDIVLGERAFGRALNGLIALLGAAAAIFCFGFLSPTLRENGLAWMATATIFSSFLFLSAAVALKAFIMTEAENFALGNGTRTGGAVKALKRPAPRSEVSQDRIQRALRKP